MSNSRNDWYYLSNPSLEWIRSVAEIPGFRWRFNAAKQVVGVEWHLSHWPFMPQGVRDIHLMDSANVGPRAAIAATAYRNSAVALRAYQSIDIPFLCGRRAALLAYEMRLGKTVTSLCAHNPDNGPLVVVGPLIARNVWIEWIQSVFGFRTQTLTGRKAWAVDGEKAYFVHYDVLDWQVASLQRCEIGTLILDECHLLQARRSKRISAAAVLAAKAKRVIGLSGTPMWSNPRSMWPILNLLAPGAWGDIFEFSKRYTNAHQGAHGWTYEGIANADELMSRLNCIVCRRTWKEVLGYLPPVTNIVEPVELTNTQRQHYEGLAHKIALSRMASGKAATSDLSTMRRMFGLAKVSRAVELAKQAMIDGHKVVLWHWHNDVGLALASAIAATCGDDLYRLESSDPQTHREACIKLFTQRATPGCFIAPLAVAGVGIDLSVADVNIFVELDWIPATNYQAAMRIFAPNRPSSNVFLYVDVPVEQRLIEVLGCNESCQTAAGVGYDEIAGKIEGVLR